MKPSAKIFLAFLMFSISNGLQYLGATKYYKTTVSEPNNVTQLQQQDSLTQPDNKSRLHKAYPPANPVQPRPDRISPGNNNQRTLPTDSGHSQQRRKAKLAGEQSKPQ